VLGISPKSPNNCVMVRINGLKRFGIVDQIYQITFGNVIESVVLLKPVVQRYGKVDKSASANFRYNLYLLRTVVGQVKEKISFFVRSSSIISLVAYRKLHPHTLGLKEGGIIMWPV
ncbi:hypothetical protein CROQUDRAFT_12489, partial [Cronartium quercuum f. sp. fusiforme G11]